MRQSICQCFVSGGDQKLPGAFWGGLEEDGRLDFGEAEVVELVSQFQSDLRTSEEAGAKGLGEAELQMAGLGGELDAVGNDNVLGELVQGLDVLQVDINTSDATGEETEFGDLFSW